MSGIAAPYAAGLIVAAALASATHAQVLTGAAAYGDWRTDAPGVARKITPADLPAPFATAPTASPSAEVPRPAGARPKAPAGFTVTEFATLDHPRQIRVAPNGDIFVAETDAGRITILRAADGAAKPATTSAFAEGLDRPFGIAFWPATNPKWVYIANNNTVVRFAYTAGDLKARGAAETIVPQIAGSTGGHTTRDIAVSADGKTLLVSVGSGSNIADGMPKKTPAETAAWAADHALGAAWGKEDGRADVLAFFPDGGGRGVYASGIRNCVSVTIEPTTGQPWCAVNERDSLGDNLPPDYVTRVKAKAFYGWPWYYIGDHEDPRLKGQRPDLAGKVTAPDVLIQPHSAPLGLTFYPAHGGVAAFPQSYRGDAFVALHGSWNRAKRTGYKVVRLKLTKGVPDGSYEDFLTGFVADDRGVWGRPVGVAVARDGALLVTDDGGGVVWRVAYSAKDAAR
jgi:glucose/arabinose dehydrogenase